MDPIPKAAILDMPRATFQRKFPDHGTAAEVDSRELQGFSLFGVCTLCLFFWEGVGSVV